MIRFFSRRLSLKSVDLNDSILGIASNVSSVPHFPSVPLKNLSSNHALNLSSLYLNVIFITYLLRSDSFSSYNQLLDSSNDLSNKLNYQFNQFKRENNIKSSFHQYVGDFLLHDESNCHSFFQKRAAALIKQSGSNIHSFEQLSDELNINIPLVQFELAPKNLYHSSLCLPPTKSDLNPAFFCQFSKIQKLKGSNRIILKLKAFNKYASLVSCFFLKLNIIKYMDPSMNESKVLATIAPKSVIESGLRFDSPLLMTAPQPCFVNYMALLFQNEPDIVSNWFKNLITSGKWKLNNNKCIFVKLNPKLPSLTIHRDQKTDLLNSNELESVAKEFISLTLTEYFVKSFPEKYSLLSKNLIYNRSLVEKHITALNWKYPEASTHLSPLGLFALYILQNPVKAKKILGGFFQSPIPPDFSKTTSFLKALIKRESISPLKTHKMVQHSGDIIQLPRVEQNKFNNIIMTNCHVHYNMSPDLEAALTSFAKLGAQTFRFYTKYWLFKKLNPWDSTYFGPLMNLLLSDDFRKTIMDTNGIFDNYFDDEVYQNLLVQHRNDIAMINTQFSQYINVLLFSKGFSKVKDWIQSSITSILEEFSGLSSEEKSVFFHNFKKSTVSTSLTRIFVDRVVNDFESSSSIDAPNKSEIDTSKYSIAQLNSLGASFIYYLKISYLIGKDDLFHTSFNTFEETSLILSKIFEKYLLHDYHFGQLVLHDGIEKTAKEIHQLLNTVMKTDFKEETVLSSWESFPIKLKILNTTDSQSEIILPKIPISDTNSNILLYSLFNSSLPKYPPYDKLITPITFARLAKWKTFGRHYYRTKIKEYTLRSANLSEKVTDSLQEILLSGRFMLMLAIKSNILLPFDDGTYSRILTNQIQNQHHVMSFGSDAFNQYICGLYFTNSKLLDSWIENLVHHYVQELLRKRTPTEQLALLSDLTFLMNNYIMDSTRKIKSSRATASSF
ncbi:hypothetical protein HYPBUDRAFT_149711 [Hyphopichia burtonii NRRL Y-1933]|uniref:Uncharacterized protein n=1 Tax=Hyphopichia burtonii NRRL Y-1933 TaxID=984485 RepID=A0A1E4RF85_9ASCO|nr:hypothetical protein HYPBUDRAFT_149711 [Hyphopichia burtonii NRRL Y-1933]ODV65927.1 hypothetical protein HYPBUDRAFT_149711 [Hyphopichia burtonii NRRL Y-1933]